VPLIRAFGRWLRRQTTDDASTFSRVDQGQAPVAAMVRTWFVILVAALGVVPIVLTGSAYEGIRRMDRGGAVAERVRWIAAIAAAAAVGVVLVAVVTRSG
jgi:hypothetical protein